MIKTGTLIKIIKLGRPQFVVGGFLLFCVGALLAVLFNAEFILSKFIFGYTILFTAHLALHYSNDYFDVNTDQYTSPTPISGGSGILIQNRASNIFKMVCSHPNRYFTHSCHNIPISLFIFYFIF